MRTRIRSVIPAAALLSLAAAVLPVAAQQDPLTGETPRWLFSNGDFGASTPDGRSDVVIVDKSSGTIAIGFQRPDGGFDWTAPGPTGMAAPTGLAVGTFNNVASSQIAVTASDENRVSVFTAADAAALPVVRHVYPASAGTRVIAAFLADGDAAADLLGAGDAGGTGAHYFGELTAALHTTPVGLWTSALPVEVFHVWPFRQKTLTPPMAAVILGSEFLVGSVRATGLDGTRTLAGFTASPATQMTWGNYDAGALAQVVLYTPGQTTARTVKVTEPAPGSFGWGTLGTLTFPRPVQLIVTVPSASGARLGVLYTDTTAATFDFNGTTLTLRSSLPGNGYELLAPVGTAAMLSRTSANAWQRWDVSSSAATLTPVIQGSLPVASPSATVSNIVFVSGGEPFVSPDAAPVYFGHVHDWTTAATGGGSLWSVTGLQQGAGGLGNPSTRSYQALPPATHALVNQLRGDVSFRTLGPAAGPGPGDAFVTPPAGTYPPLEPGAAFQLTFTSTLPGSVIRYRLAAGAAWSVYDPNAPPSLVAGATVQFHARSAAGTTPTRTATYAFAAESPLTTGALVDGNGNGLPDQWEKAFAAFNPAGDEDGDGSSNLAEYQNGTDPRNAASVQPGTTMVLNAAITGSGPSRSLRLTWPTSNATAVLQSSTTLATWTDVTSGITISGGDFVYIVPLSGAIPEKRYYRLRRP